MKPEDLFYTSRLWSALLPPENVLRRTGNFVCTQIASLHLLRYMISLPAGCAPALFLPVALSQFQVFCFSLFITSIFSAILGARVCKHAAFIHNSGAFYQNMMCSASLQAVLAPDLLCASIQCHRCLVVELSGEFRAQ